MTLSRNRWLSAATAVLALIGVGATAAKAEDTIKIGILHSLSGTMAISETILKDLILMEVADINAHGGLLGKKIEVILADHQLKPDIGAGIARRWYDTESIAQDGDTLYVGIERVHQIVRFDYGRSGLLARGQPIAVPPTLKQLPSNGSIEALESIRP